MHKKYCEGCLWIALSFTDLKINIPSANLALYYQHVATTCCKNVRELPNPELAYVKWVQGPEPSHHF